MEALESNDWDLDMAIAEHFDGGDANASGQGGSGDENMTVPPAPSGGRRLGDTSTPSQSVAASSASGTARSSRKQPKKGGVASLRDFQEEEHGHDHDDDSDKDQDLYVGGDKSGLAVTEPGAGHNQHIQRLLDRARKSVQLNSRDWAMLTMSRNGPPPPKEETRASNFSGQGQTLGGDDVPSRVIPDPNADTPRSAPMVERTLHIWDDGFSIDDGPLHRYDDPANRRTLEMINRGSAPLELMNVEPGQAVDVRLDQHRGENYTAPKKKFTPFAGGGQRLGSPVPGAPSSFSAPAAPPYATSTSSASSAGITIDDNQPTITLQIRLADGTRLPSRFNITHTIEDVYGFVSRASPESSQRPYSLATTFPTKELTDKSQILGDMPEFKRGGVLVQKWH